MAMLTMAKYERFWSIVSALVVGELDRHRQSVQPRLGVVDDQLNILVAEGLGPATVLRLELQQLRDLLGLHI